jgi:hypothetical protein
MSSEEVVMAADPVQVRFSSPSGEAEEVDLPAGATMWREAEEHSTENVGTTEVRALLFELK